MSEADRLADAFGWTPGVLLAALALGAAAAGLAAARRAGGCRAAGAILLAAAAAALGVDLGRPDLEIHPAAPALALAAAGLLVLGPGRLLAGRARAVLGLALAGSALLVAGWADSPPADESRARDALRRRLERGREGGDPAELYLVLETLADDRWFDLAGFDRHPELAAPVLAGLGRTGALARRLDSSDPRMVREAALALALAGDDRGRAALERDWGSSPRSVDAEALRTASALGAIGDRRALDWAAARHRDATAEAPATLDAADRRVRAKLRRREAEALERAASSFRADLADEFARRTGVPPRLAVGQEGIALEAARGTARSGPPGELYELVSRRPLRSVEEDRAWAILLVEVGGVPSDEALERDLADPRGPSFALAAWTAVLARRRALRPVFALRLEVDDRPLVCLGVLAIPRGGP